MGRWRHRLFCGIVAAVGFLAASDVAFAETVIVDTTTDSAAAGFQACTAAANDCSLRGAIVKLNGSPGPHTIQLPAGTYTLTIVGRTEEDAATGDLDIRRAITIDGGGTSTTIVQAGPNTAVGIDRVFDVVENNGHGNLTLRDLTVQHGLESGQGGGGIRADGPLTLERVHVRANQTAFAGGGVSLLANTTIRDSAISENTAQAANGGAGIAVNAGGSVVTVESTTIYGNTATNATSGGGGFTQATSATTSLNNVTIVGNSANQGGGVRRTSGTLTIRNSILANNTATVGSAANCSGSLTTQGNNLVFGGDGSCTFNAGLGDIIDTGDPLLGPFVNNGGPTPTLALGAGSAAIDSGNAAAPGSGGSSCAARDQRGVARPEDGDGAGGARCDIGAFEVTATAALLVDRVDDSAAATACTAAVNDCSLRGAVISANTAGGRIVVPHGTYTLTVAGQNEENAATGDLDVRRAVTITGAGAVSTTIQAGTSPSGGIDRLFEVHANGGLGNLTLRELRVRHGTATQGGGISAAGPLTLERVELRDNQATNGGGAVISAGGTIRESLVAGNQATTGAGGGLLVNAGPALTVTNVTIAQNAAPANVGGGLANAGTTTLNNVTIAGNTANQGGGVVANSGTLNVRNTAIASNTATTSGPNCHQVTSLASQGNNLVFGGDTCNFSGSGDLQNQNPLLGPLQDNGGPTQSMGLGAGSAAVDAGNAAAPGGGGNACAATDQRGQNRPVDGNGDGTARCDIGAVELLVLAVDRTDDVASATACTTAANDCSLRGAILNANGKPDAHVVLLPAGTYRLTVAGTEEDAAATGDLDILRTIEIVGASATTTFIEGGPNAAAGIDRVFHAIALNGARGDLTLTAVTVRHGNATDEGGGAILADGPVTLRRVHIASNQSASLGGGLLLRSNASILDSTISGNTVSAATSGGGIGIGAGGISVLVQNVTLSGNSVPTGSAGAISQVSVATTTLNNVTVAGNSANSTGGISRAVGTMFLRNTILANNTATTGASNCAGNITSQGHNLIFGGDGSCTFNAGLGDLIDTGNPVLGPLQNNGGQTPTMALGTGSAAIDAGNSGTPGTGGVTCAASDQRGTARPIDGDGANGPRCDVGAFEAAAFNPCVPRPRVQLSVTRNGQGGFAVTVTRGSGTIVELRFRGAASAQVPTSNALVDIPGQPPGQSGTFTFTPAAGTTSQSFTVRPANPSLRTTLPLDVVDGCGVWPTFVGGSVAGGGS